MICRKNSKLHQRLKKTQGFYQRIRGKTLILLKGHGKNTNFMKRSQENATFVKELWKKPIFHNCNAWRKKKKIVKFVEKSYEKKVSNNISKTKYFINGSRKKNANFVKKTAEKNVNFLEKLENAYFVKRLRKKKTWFAT